MINSKMLILVVYAGILFSCTEHNKVSKNETKAIDREIIKIDVVDNDLKENDYTNIFDSLSVIILETNENSIIGGIRKIIFKHQKFYIQDENHNILIFNENGSFVNKLNKRGKGPGEYFELRDFHVDEDGNIMILSWKRILTYNLYFDCIDEFNFNIRSDTGRELNPIFFMPSEENIFLFMGSFGINSFDSEKEMALYCINRKKKILKQFFPVDYELTHLHRMFYCSNNELNYTNGYGNDTIYKIEKVEIFPKYIIDFQNKNISKYDMLEDRAKLFQKIWEKQLKGNISNVFENNEYLCFQFLQGRTAKQVVYNKKSKRQKILNVLKSKPFPAIIVAGVIDSSYFFSAVEPYIIVHMNKNGFYDKLIFNFDFNEISDTDNPIIFKYRFKI